MTSIVTEAMAGDDLTFPAKNAAEELKREKQAEFPVDPISSNVAAAKKHKEEAAAARKRAREAKAEKSGSTLMSVLMITGVVAAAVGVAFFVTKKLKETQTP